MSVAKSYEKYPIQGDPFIENDKKYVHVQTPKGLKKVRWYEPTSPTCTLRACMGFYKDGYITMLVGDDKIIDDWAHSTYPYQAWYNTWFGWFVPSIISFDTLTPLPPNVTPIRITWEDVNEMQDRQFAINKIKEMRENVLRNSSL